MAGTQVSKKPRKIRGLTEVVPKVPIFTWVYGKRQPRTEMWATEISDQNETSNQLEHLQNHNLMPVMENQNVQMDVDQPTIFVQDHDGLLGLPLESESTPEVLNGKLHFVNSFFLFFIFIFNPLLFSVVNHPYTVKETINSRVKGQSFAICYLRDNSAKPE